MQNNHVWPKTGPQVPADELAAAKLPDGTYDEAKLAEWGILIPSSQLPQGWQKALKHGAFQVIQCPHCPMVFPSAQRVWHHGRNKHPKLTPRFPKGDQGVVVRCDECRYVGRSQTDLYHHKQLHRLAKAGYERWDARATYAAYRYEHSQQINDQARFWRGTRTAEQKPDHDVPVNRQALFTVLPPAKKDR